MHLVLRYPDGRRADALLLRRDEAAMRIVLRGRNETIELRFVRGSWLTEDGERVSIEAILMDPHQGGRQTNTKYKTAAETTNTANTANLSNSSDRTQ